MIYNTILFLSLTKELLRLINKLCLRLKSKYLKSRMYLMLLPYIAKSIHVFILKIKSSGIDKIPLFAISHLYVHTNSINKR